MISIKSTFEIAKDIARKSQSKRLKLNLTQKTLSERSGVSYGALKKFEQKGKISLESLLKIALVLGELDTFEHLFTKRDDGFPLSLDEILNDGKRKRGRK